MTRYLLFISYIGTRFRGAQKQVVNAELTKSDPETVQGILEICSKSFKPVNEPHVYISSRTDRGVHALCSSAHVDLERNGCLKYDPAHLTVAYNRYFINANVDLRVQSVHIVPETFHARYSVKSRTYLYRLAVRNPDAPPLNKSSAYMAEIPFVEWNRCHFIQNVDKFDMSLLKAAATLFPGTRDFRTFMGQSAGNSHITTVKEMYKLDISPGRPLIGAEYCSCCSHYSFWDITCQGRSFLYRQVMRMVGALISVAEGHISVGEIQYMLENPSKHSWNSRINVVPPYGLYLTKVEY
ncbi:hypothetical protein L798_02012, partial [Zootermopsis nevadensis]